MWRPPQLVSILVGEFAKDSRKSRFALPFISLTLGVRAPVVIVSGEANLFPLSRLMRLGHKSNCVGW